MEFSTYTNASFKLNLAYIQMQALNGIDSLLEELFLYRFAPTPPPFFKVVSYKSKEYPHHENMPI